jgi:DNA replication protein DnaC
MQNPNTEILTCAVHGAYPVLELSHGGVVMRKTRCNACVVAELASEEAARAAKESAIRQSRLAAKFKQSAIPEGFQDRTFANFIADAPGKEKALRIATKFADAFPAMLQNGASLLFLGGIGTGKTHLAVAIGQRVMAAGYSCMYETQGEMVIRLRDCMRRDASESMTSMLDSYGNVDLLLLDEVGILAATDDVKAHIMNVMDRRYRNGKPTILLSNLTPKEFVDYVGERVADRLRERATAVIFDWESGRSKARINAGF